MAPNSIPKTAKAWTVHGTDGFEGLKFNGEAAIPEISDYEVLVKIHAASLNYRDLIIPKGKFIEQDLRFSVVEIVNPTTA